MQPEVRFLGFEGDWKQQKLENLAESFEYGLNVSAKAYDGENKYLRITDIDDETHEFLQNNLTSPDTDLSKLDNYLLNERDLLFARTGASVGKSYHYNKKDGKVYFAGFLIRAKIKPSFNSEFVFQNTLTQKYINFIKISSQRSGQPGVNAKEYASLRIAVPDVMEQKKIGTFFKQFDDTIHLHKQELTTLKQTKQGFLQKMFPKEGEKVPEVRFPGFTDDWEQRKLGDVTSSYSGGTPSASNKSYYGGKIPFIRSAEVNSDSTELLLTEDGLNNSSAKMVEVGDILYALYGATSGEVGISRINGAINQAILAIKPNKNHDSRFIMQWLRLQKQKIIDKYLQGGQGNLSGSIVKDLHISFPSLEEQKRIGEFFKGIDDLLTLHQRELELLQLTKKAFLQKLFV
mgnify:CR=1 FL=1